MDRSDYRKQIDRIDEQLVKLFAERMEVAGRLAEYKKENSLPVLDVRREREKLHSVSEQSPEELRDYTELLYSLIFELSRSYQNRLIGTGTELTARIEDAVKNTPPLFP